MFQGSFKGVSRKFQGSFKDALRKFKGVSGKFHGCLMEVLRVFQGTFKEVLSVFYESFESEEVSWMFQGCFMIFNSVSRVFQRCFKKVPRKFQESFEKVSRKFHVTWHSSQLPEQKEGLLNRENRKSLSMCPI